MRIIYLYLQWMLIKIGDVVHVHTHIYIHVYIFVHACSTHTQTHTHTHLPYVYMCMYIYCVFWCTLAPSQSISSHPRAQEWIATCPIMQLKLVVLAGARVPSYRRFMMPLLSVAVLLCGTASMFTGDALRFGWYGFGLCCLTWGLWGLWGLKKIDGTNPNGNSSKYDSELQVN